jgi:hypothetical protein
MKKFTIRLTAEITAETEGEAMEQLEKRLTTDMKRATELGFKKTQSSVLPDYTAARRRQVWPHSPLFHKEWLSLKPANTEQVPLFLGEDFTNKGNLDEEVDGILDFEAKQLKLQRQVIADVHTKLVFSLDDYTDFQDEFRLLFDESEWLIDLDDQIVSMVDWSKLENENQRMAYLAAKYNIPEGSFIITVPFGLYWLHLYELENLV